MTILVVGGAGYLGSALLKRLSNEEERVRVMDNMRRQRYVTLWNLKQGLEFYEGDIRNDKDIEKCIEDVDTVFCLADVTNAGKSFEREEFTKEVNYNGVTKLFEKAAEAGVKNFIYTSSASVYGDTPKLVDEGFECDPISPYGRYKLKAEKHILHRSKETSMNTVALRLGTVYGYSKGMRFDTVINYFTYLASQGKPLTVHKSALDEHRPYVHVSDVVRAYMFAKNNSKKMSGEVFNVINENMQMEDVIEVISEVFPSLDKEYVDNPTENKVSYRISDDKIKRLGFRTKHNMLEGVNSVKEKFSHLDTVSET